MNEENFFDQIKICNNYFPYYEKKFGIWLKRGYPYHKLQLERAIGSDKSERKIAIDLGANVGLITNVLSKFYERVIAFEPSLQNRACLYRNIKTKKNNIIVYPYAVGDKEETLELTNNDVNCGGSQIMNEKETRAIGTTQERVEVKTLDSMINPKDIIDSQISLIKIDIQGYELKAIMGAENIIKQYKPIIWCEVEVGEDTNQDEISDHLKKLGYVAIWKINKDMIYQERNAAIKSRKEYSMGEIECID